jgi:hypothetical protein
LRKKKRKAHAYNNALNIDIRHASLKSIHGIKCPVVRTCRAPRVVAMVVMESSMKS